MQSFSKKFSLSTLFLLGLPFAYGPAVYAAKPINLRHQPVSHLQQLMASPSKVTAFKELSRHTDFNKTLHVRIQQTYAGYDVLGADLVVHMPRGNKAKAAKSLINSAPADASMNGIIYQALEADLGAASPAIFTEAQAQKALKHTINQYEKNETRKISDTSTQLMVYIDQDQKAHWAYKVSFLAESNKEGLRPAKPVYIIDADKFTVYMHWDDIKTIKPNEDGGGFGGNKKMGKLVYDGQSKNLAKLNFNRDDAAQTCYFKNDDVSVTDYNTGQVMSFNCASLDPSHNNVYWDGSFGAVNDGYSPGNDALFGGQVIKRMYQDWYGMPVLRNEDGSPMLLKMVVHLRKYDNAYWDGRQMTFGDGYTYFYPLTSLGVAAHEISHGFTQQHSNLIYSGQSGGMNEAFSDMAAQAAEVYAYGSGKNSWQIGPEIFKAENEALRYMDKPSKDCKGGTPGNWCSIDDATQYTSWLDVHYSSGVYNRFFYTLGTTDGWDAKKAFDVMVAANVNYWTSGTSFSEGACGVISAAQDLKYNVASVKAAFDVVKVDYSQC